MEIFFRRLRLRARGFMAADMRRAAFLFRMPGNCADISPARAAGGIGFLRAGGYIAFHGLAAYFERSACPE